ncbi:MAG: AAA family ATPase [Ekhidna sp.]|nr:AAA family ATPase [Ekhidna sp.]
MNNEEKQQIQKALSAYIERFQSQNEAANSLVKVSPGTVSQIMNGNWKQISDEMWRKVSGQIGGHAADWHHVEIQAFRKLRELLSDAHLNGQVCAVTGDGGVGKTHAFRHYAALHHNVIWLRCEKYWTQKYLLEELLRGLGIDPKGRIIVEMMEEISDRIKKRGQVLIIFDQFNKLRDSVKDYLIPLYNDLEGSCGFFISGTEHLKTCFQRGVRWDKEGYQEMYSRMGRKFVEVKRPSKRDVQMICLSNGVSGDEAEEIWADCEQDLRRVKRKIHGLKVFKSSSKAA